MTSEVDFGRVLRFEIGRQRNDDESPTPYEVGTDDILAALFSIFARFFTIVLNIILLLDYYKREEFDYFRWTLGCLVIPAVITTVLMVYINFKMSKFGLTDNSLSGSKYKQRLEILINIIIIPFLFRYFHTFKYAVSSLSAKNKNDRMQEKYYYDKLVQEESNVAFIRIFESFLEAAPQKTLQIAIMLPFSDIRLIQILSIAGCMISLTWCMTSYQKQIRIAQQHKKLITLFGIVLHFCWQFFMTVSRVLSIAIIADLFPDWTIVGCLVHAIVMGLWIFTTMRSDFCNYPFWNWIYSFLLGLVFIYNFVTPKEGETRYKYLFYNTILGLENLVCIFVSIYFQSDKISIYYLIIYISIVISFILSMLSQIFYYIFFHPNV